jgi:hypothetical protein
MVYQSTPTTTTQWINSWQQRLMEVVDHVQPWTAAAGGIPAWVRDQPVIRELVEFMDNRVSRLARIVAQQSGSVDSWTIAYIEHELTGLLDVAKTFDHSLRRRPGRSDESFAPCPVSAA